MKRKAVKLTAVILSVFCLWGILLSGCSAEQDDGTVTLRVLMEASHHDTTTFLFKSVLYWKFQFESEHENVNVVIEQLPESDEEREIVMERLRAELMAGDGPDVLLLPTSDQWNTTYPVSFEGMLIADVNHAMYNGIFADISEYYDADTELGKEELLTVVMDAGVAGEQRFVLPLRYNIPVAYVDLGQLAEQGLRTDIFDGTITDLWDAIIQTGNNALVGSARLPYGYEYQYLHFFPRLIDYENQEVLLTRQELVDFAESYRALWIVGSGSYPAGPDATLKWYAYDGISWMSRGYCLYFQDMNYAIQMKGIATAEDVELGMFPLRTMDGSLAANISYYGAVSAGSEHPELAYEFLRYFLSEEAQWEKNIDYANEIGTTHDTFSADGWPVRARGAVPYLSYNLYARISNNTSGGEHSSRFRSTKVLMLKDEDIPILDAQIDAARFRTPLDSAFYSALDELYVTSEYFTVDVDLNTWADNFIQKMEWH